jgi:hypothetical protein
MIFSVRGSFTVVCLLFSWLSSFLSNRVSFHCTEIGSFSRYRAGVATMRLAHIASENNIQVAYVHMRLTVRDVLKYLLKKGDTWLTDIDLL